MGEDEVEVKAEAETNTRPVSRYVHSFHNRWFFGQYEYRLDRDVYRFSLPTDVSLVMWKQRSTLASLYDALTQHP